MKYAVVILDGAAGEPLDCFDGRTSLEQANTPFLDSLAREGSVGLARNVPAGMEPASNVACMSLMGYDPNIYDIGRGAIEGASLGVDLGPGDVALRVNLCCVQDGLMHSYSSGNIDNEDSYALADQIRAALDDDTFTLTKGVSFRHILKVKGHPELMDLLYTAPHNITDMPVEGHDPQVPEGASEAAVEAARLLAQWCERANAILADSSVNERRVKEGLLPATNVWAFWPGMRPGNMEPFEKVYGKNAGMLSPVDLLNGLAVLTGVKRYHVPGLTDGLDNDFEAQGKKALEMLDECDVVFIHIEAPDTAGHDGEPRQKVEAIERIDAEIVGRLYEYASNNDLRILASPDHPTPIRLKTHSNQMVPFVMAGPGLPVGAGERMTEAEATASGLVVDPGCTLMSRLLK